MEPSLEWLRKIVGDVPKVQIAVTIEKRISMVEVLSARSSITIKDNKEPLVQISSDKVTLTDPHPYLAAGAQYDKSSPFALRSGVIDRLYSAQDLLSKEKPGYRFYIFDGYRPKAVQIYMRQFDHDRIAREDGLDLASLSPEQDQKIWAKVDLVWARPSADPDSSPTPHSTGSAVDLTILDAEGRPLEMGSEFDEPSARILPNYYLDQKNPKSLEICDNRELLNRVLSVSGFRRLTHEWWHFSYGDQIWALLESLEKGGEVAAIYGEVG